MTSFPKSSTRIGQGAGDDPLAAAFQYEAAADMAVSLGMAGRRVEAALAALAIPGDRCREMALGYPWARSPRQFIDNCMAAIATEGLRGAA